MKKILYISLIIMGLTLQSLSVAAINATDGIAINGYDPVSYFSDKGPIPGSKEITYYWMGAIWRFFSDENRSKFIKEPEHYAPQYGGYCAYAASKGALAPVNAYAYSILNGKLYLNNSTEVKNRWLGDRDYYIRQGDANWPRLNKH